jgi:pSer/pThr/pTyr-binding forkhead associated (FHA) protein
MAKLVVLSEGFTGLSHELKGEKTTVGRLEDNSFQVAEASVSSHHCEILQRGSDLVVKDLNSTNGTFINGEQVTEAVLKPGQILRLGQVEIRLEAGGGAGGPAAAGKKPLDKTMVIAQGVKVAELDQGSRPTVEASTAFTKKSNKINRIFIAIGVVLGLAIVVFIVIAVKKMSQ